MLWVSEPGVHCSEALKMATAPPDKPRMEVVALHLTPGKMNAVRAAFKSGVKTPQIARQFGLSQSDVRKALASDASRPEPNHG
jgi:hypothetical protein